MPRRSILRTLLALALLWVAAPLCEEGAFPRAGCAAMAATGPERITTFDAKITVQPSGVVEVTERITAVAQGDQIKRGIFRDLIQPSRSGLDCLYGPAYRVREARRDGGAESWHIEDKGEMFRVYLGKKDVLLRPGSYAYTLAYDALFQVRFFQDYDEVYWNVTGNAWAFPVERARAEVVLPPGATVRQFAAYTGPKGYKGADFVVRQKGPDRVVIESTRPLQPGEGLTVAVAWPKGFVSKPEGSALLLAALTANPAMATAVAGFVCLMAYFITAWAIAGRDPEKGAIIPLYSPPPDISPAAARYISRMGYDSKDLPCAIVGLAVHGALTIAEKEKGEFTLTRKDKKAGTLDEDLTAKALFEKGSPLEVDQSRREVLQDAREHLRKALRNAYTGYLFKPNLNWFIPGALLTLATVAATVFAAPRIEEAAFAAVWLSAWTLGTSFLLTRVAASWHEALIGRGRFLKWSAAIFATAFAVPFVLGELIGLFFFGMSSSPLAAALLLASGTACAVFYHLLKAPTKEGRQVMDQLEGFELYLGVAEKDRLNLLNPPEETPELFEKYLPYAMALDVEQQWGERFAEVLARAAQSPQGYSPAWYSGSSWDSSSPGSFGDSLGSAFSSAVSSSSGSSGSGGSGGSGGGGGGGGGGGW